MDDVNFSSLVVQAGVSFIAAGVAGFWSVYLANEKHRTQKFWELKLEEYQKLFNILFEIEDNFHQLKFLGYTENIESEDELDKNQAQQKELNSSIGKYYKELINIIEYSNFHFSDETNNILKRMKNEMEVLSKDWGGININHLKFLKETIVILKNYKNEIIISSKSDLKIKNGLLE